MTKYVKSALSVVVVIILGILTATLSAPFLPVEWPSVASSLAGLVVVVLGIAASLSQIIGLSLRDVFDFEGRRAKRNIGLLLLNEIEDNHRGLEGGLVKQAFPVGQASWGLTVPLRSSEYRRFSDHPAVLGYPAGAVRTLRRYYDAIGLLNRRYGPPLPSAERIRVAQQFIEAEEQALQLGAWLADFLRERPLTVADAWLLAAATVLLVLDAAIVASILPGYRPVVPSLVDAPFVPTAGAALSSLSGICILAFLASRRSLALGSRIRLAALGGVAAILLTVLSVLTVWVFQQLQPPREIIILVTQIQGPEPAYYRVSDIIMNKLRSDLANVENVRVEYLTRSVSEGEGSDLARALGTRPFGSNNDAAIVIWGWYGVTETHVEVMLTFELLTKPPDTPQMQTGLLRIYEIVQINSFTLQTELSQEMIYLSALVAGLADYESQDYVAAEESFTVALSQPEGATQSLGREVVLTYRGLARQQQYRYEEAISDYTQAIAANPDYPDAWNNCGLAYAHLSVGAVDPELMYLQAKDNFNEAIRLAPKSADAYNNRGVLNYHFGLYQEAIRDFTEALRIEPGFPRAYSNRGAAQHALHEYEEAIADYTHAIRIDQSLSGAYLGRGLAHHDLSQYGQAIADLQSYLRLAPSEDEYSRKAAQRLIDEMRP